jgi:hypothetical protein
LSTKEKIKNQIADSLGLKPEENPPMSTGSTEPKRIFELVDQRLDLRVDPDGSLSKPELAKAIVVRSGQDWHAGCESAGGTVTKVGLLKVLYAVSSFVQERASESGPFSPEQLGIENDYAKMSTGNTGGQYECAIAALLMPPQQLEEFRDVAIARKRWGEGSKFDLMCQQIDSDLINKHCLQGLPNTDQDRYVECSFQDDRNGPSDIVVHDLRAKHTSFGISVKHGNTNIKNISLMTEDGFDVGTIFMERQMSEVRRITPDWIKEMTTRFGPLEFSSERPRNWRRQESDVSNNYLNKLGSQVMELFNDKTIEERVQLTKSLLHLDHNPLRNFFILKTKNNTRGYFIDHIIKQNDHNFACKDPTMGSLPSRTKKRIFDKSGMDSIGIDIQFKFNNGFAEHKTGSGSNRRICSLDDLNAQPDKYFPVETDAATYVLKHGSLSSHNATLAERPSTKFWDFLYEHGQ